jgi:hypothetical protein
MTPEQLARLLGPLSNDEQFNLRPGTPLTYPGGGFKDIREFQRVIPDARSAQSGAVRGSGAAARGIGSFLGPLARFAGSRALAPLVASNRALAPLAALLMPSELGDGTFPQAPALPEEPEGFPEASAVQSGFGYEGFDSASVSKDPEVGILSIDLLSPDMPDDLPSRGLDPSSPSRGLDPSSSLRPEARPLPREQMPPRPRPLPREQMPPRPRPQTYEVQSGDYLGRIAQRSGMSLARLLELNPQIENPDLIYPGQMINLG